MKKQNRIKKSFLNSSANVTIYLIQSILSFVVRTVFIRKLGSELLGLDSLLINILTALSLADLGISTAISYGLYKPLADNKIKKINAYMCFYKKVYRIIGSVIIFIGFILMLFLRKIVGDVSYPYLYIIYLLYLFNTVSLYFISYKDILLVADQKNYKIFKYNCFFNSSIYVFQFILLMFYPNYILYILIMILSKLINRVIINRYITKEYKEIDFNSKEKLTKKEIESIKNTVSGLLCYRIGDYAINCTDNIIISSIINVVTVGVYTNYLSIISILKTIISNLFYGITSSYGNLVTEKNKEAEFNVFNIMSFIGFFITGYVTLCFLNLLNPFVQLWIGKKYVISLISMILICINFYLICNQMPLDTVKQANGFCNKDKYVPVIQAIINIVLSIILGKILGLNGIIIATAISYIVTVFWNKPYMLYKYIFRKSSKGYFLNQFKYCITIIICYLITYNLFNYLNLNISILSIIIIAIITSLIYLLIVTLLYFRTSEYKFLLNFIKCFILRFIRRSDKYEG